MAVKKSKPAEPETKKPHKNRDEAEEVGGPEGEGGGPPPSPPTPPRRPRLPRPKRRPEEGRRGRPEEGRRPRQADRPSARIPQADPRLGEEFSYPTAKKAELKTLEILLDKKLIKKGAKDKASGNFRYTVSKAGEKHISSVSPS